MSDQISGMLCRHGHRGFQEESATSSFQVSQHVSTSCLVDEYLEAHFLLSH